MLRRNQLIGLALITFAAGGGGAYIFASGAFGRAPIPHAPSTLSRDIAPTSLDAEAPASLTPSDRPVRAGIDVARIDPNGTSVIAGFADPSETVTVLDRGMRIGTVQADKSGDWVLITEYDFSDPNPTIELKTEQSEKKGTLVAAGSIPQGSKGLRSAEQQVATLNSTEAVHFQLLERLETLVDPDEKSKDARPGARNASSADVGNKKIKTHAAEEIPLVKSAIPIPIKFIYQQAQLTDEGKQAALLLLNYLKAKDFKTVSLTGHADERGSEAYNTELSRMRLEEIARILRGGGFGGQLVLIPKGEAVPFTGVDRSKFSAQDLYKLDRRVELLGAN